jgi:hypothetical protein
VDVGQGNWVVGNSLRRPLRDTSDDRWCRQHGPWHGQQLNISLQQPLGLNFASAVKLVTP